MQVFRVILAGAALLVAGGCKSSYNQTTATVAPHAPPLRANSRVYVAMPEDALDKRDTVPGSGKRTALALQDAFKRQSRNVLTSRMPETLEEAIDHARDLNYEYVAFPAILKWQDRPTQWTGVRDKLQIKIDVIAVDTGDVLRTTNIDATGKWMTDGGEAPQDLLAEPVDKFVRSLFRMTYTPSALRR